MTQNDHQKIFINKMGAKRLYLKITSTIQKFFNTLFLIFGLIFYLRRTQAKTATSSTLANLAEANLDRNYLIKFLGENCHEKAVISGQNIFKF